MITISVIVLKDGTVLCDPENFATHEELIEAHDIVDDCSPLRRGSFQRAYFFFRKGQVEDLSAWKLESACGGDFLDWVNVEDLRSQLESRISRMLVGGSKELLLGGCWILYGNARVVNVSHATILYMYGESHIKYVDKMTHVDCMTDTSTVMELYGRSHIRKMGGKSHVKYLCSSSIDKMCDQSRISSVESSTIRAIEGNAVVEHLGECSFIAEVAGEATVLDGDTVSSVGGRVGWVRGNAKVPVWMRSA